MTWEHQLVFPLKKIDNHFFEDVTMMWYKHEMTIVHLTCWATVEQKTLINELFWQKHYNFMDESVDSEAYTF